MHKQLLDFVSRLDVLLVTACILLFTIFPNIDLHLSKLFFDSEKGFVLDDSQVAHLIYMIFAFIHIPALIYLTWLAVRLNKKQQLLASKRHIFLICCLLVGPGIVVNIVLKDNSVGRPRPNQIQAFESPLARSYAPPFTYSGECEKNCSFTSGHAAIGFFAMAFFWTTRRKRYFIGGLALGSALGVMRIAQGAHFLSDVVFSFWVVYFTCLLLSRYFNDCLPQEGNISDNEIDFDAKCTLNY